MVWAISPFLRLIEASIAETHNDLDAKDPSELQASLEPATDIAQISEFFKDNPWGIAKKNVGGRDWWVWERKTPIYLIPADSGTPLFYKSGASIEAELLLIPIPAGTNPILFIDLKDYTVKPKDGFSNCDFPSYFVVPKLPKAESKLLPNPIIIPDNGDKDKYVPVPIGIEPDDKSDPFRALLYADGGLGNIAGISVALHPKCASTYNLYNVRKDDKDHFTEETHHYYPSVRIQEQEVEVENKQCIIVDTSASMGSVDINYLAKKGAEAVIDFVTSEALEEKPRLIKDGDIILYGLNLRSQHQGIALNPAEFVNSDGIDRARNSGGGIRRSDVAGFIDSEKLFERIAAELKKMVDSGDVFVGPDAAPESLKSVIDGCNNGYAYLTDTWPDFRSLPPAILVEDGNFLREEEGGLYLSSPGKMINFSLSSGEPLIITSQLVDFYENSEVPPSQKALEAQEFLKGHKVDVKVLEEKKSDPVLLHHLLPGLYNLPLQERSGAYEFVTSIILNENYDVSIKKRGTALLAAWAWKNDEAAKSTLWGLYERSESLSLELNTYIAKCMAPIIGDGQVSEVVSEMRAEPASFKNMLKLMLLAGKSVFNGQLKFLRDDVWSLSLKYPARPNFPTLYQALAGTFSSPVISYDKYTGGLSQDELFLLEGFQWGNEQMQDIFNIFSDAALPSLSEELKVLMGAILYYTGSLFKGGWTKGDRIRINPFSEKRFWYEMPLEDVEDQITALVPLARHEEGWNYFKHKDREATFETGIFHKWNKAMVYTDWPFIKEKIGAESDGSRRVEVIQIHIHPSYDLTMDEMAMFPSVADLKYFLQFMQDLNKKYPSSDCEFHIISRHGVTVIRPTFSMENMAKDGDGKEDFAKMLSNYQKYTDGHVEMFNYGGAKGIIQRYFTIKLPDEDKNGR